MSSKRRRAKKTPDPAEGPADDVGAADAKGAEGAKANVASEEKAEAKPAAKRSLPAFGFAGDLLKKKDSETPSEKAADAKKPRAGDGEAMAEDAAAKRPDHGGEGTDDEPNPGANAPGTAESNAQEPALDNDPHRIFSFADQLQSRQEQQQKDKGPEAKWETWVTFSLDDEVFAVPVEPVRQVVRVANITRVPHAPRPIRGVTNLRGRVIPVIDLRMRVGLEPSEIGRQSRVVAVASRRRLLGLLVDAVHQVVHIDLNKVQPPPEDVMSIESDYILGVYHQDDALILLLDVDRALVLREEAA